MNWRSAARISTQVLLVAPMVLMFPFAILLSLSILQGLLRGGFEDMSLQVALAQILAPVGLVFLFLSIVLTTRALRSHAWRSIVTAGLAVGLIATVVWLAALATEPDGHAPPIFHVWTIYLFGGPVVVAVWNLVRAWRAEKLQ